LSLVRSRNAPLLLCPLGHKCQEEDWENVQCESTQSFSV
jgi:hypothetical protein